MRHILLIILPALLPLMAGCGLTSYFSNDRVAVVPYDQAAMRSIQQGRAYASQGRLDLAKEQYITALASATDEATHSIAAHELEAVEQTIQSQR
jgi:hypothetical protein